ncbi:MAG: hypothetical protein FWF43_02735 [Propionibacteriaceae bacterium]|nr:hypothetical protein [Propionibacteriaceae bacterium]
MTAPVLPPYYEIPPAERTAALPQDVVMQRCGLTNDDLELLRDYGDVLLPENGRAPRFSDADPDGEVLGLALAQVGHRLAQLLAVLKTTPGADAAERLEALQAAQPDRFTELRDLLVCCYLSTPMIWEIVGYDGRKQHLPEPGEAESYLAGGLLDQVVARGPIYITPDN